MLAAVSVSVAASAPGVGAAPTDQVHYPDLRTEPPSELKWGDRYGPDLAGQYLDVSTVPDGTYWLKSTADYQEPAGREERGASACRLRASTSGPRE